MSGLCNGLCTTHMGGVKNCCAKSINPYTLGYSYCGVCACYFFTLGRPARCGCCKKILRLRPRDGAKLPYAIVSHRPKKAIG